MNPQDLLRELMRRSGDNPNSLSNKVLGRTKQPQIYKFLEGISKEPKRSTLEPIAEFYGIPVEAFYDVSLSRQTYDLLVHGEESRGATLIELKELRTGRDRGDTLVIPQFDTGGSIGRSVLLREQPGVIQGWRVSPEWVEKNIRNHSAAANLCIVTGFGDSMKGMFNPGDPLVVDTGVTYVDYDAVYFFGVDGEGFIKRLQRIPGEGIRVLSENKHYEAWTIKPSMDFQVFGRVLKAWQGEDF
jgi:hypothetical protein